MIHDLDEGLRTLLLGELPKEWQVNIEFDQPRREWSARLNNKPTINLFLYDVRENNQLRQSEWQITRNPDGSSTKTRTPVRVDLHYMITAWAAEAEDEHRLLAGALIALFRHPTLEESLLPESLHNQPVPIPMRVAEQESLRNPADIWGAMDNELRPAISCKVTIALNPFHSIAGGSLVKTRDLRTRQVPSDELDTSLWMNDDYLADRMWMIGGTVRGTGPLDNVQLTLVERGQEVMVKPNGDFIIGNLEQGDYTLSVARGDAKRLLKKITVPSPSYDIDLEEGGTSKQTTKTSGRR